MDQNARKSARRVAKAGRDSAARIEIEARNVARKIGHHGWEAVYDEMRLRGVAVQMPFIKAIWEQECDGRDKLTWPMTTEKTSSARWSIACTNPRPTLPARSRPHLRRSTTTIGGAKASPSPSYDTFKRRKRSLA